MQSRGRGKARTAIDGGGEGKEGEGCAQNRNEPERERAPGGKGTTARQAQEDMVSTSAHPLLHTTTTTITAAATRQPLGAPTARDSAAAS